MAHRPVTPLPTADALDGAEQRSRARQGFGQTFAAFQHRNYRILWLSMAASFTAMQMQMVARGWLAFEISGNYSAVGIVMMSWGLPQLLFSLVGGAVADRVDKRKVLFITQAAVGLTALVTAVAITAGFISIPFLFIVGLIQGTVFAFNLPARQALIPELVPKSGLMNAMALNNAAMNGTRIIAPAIAGVLMAAVGVDSVFYLQGILNFGVVLILAQLPRSTSHEAGAARRGSMAREIGVGLSYIWGSRSLRLLMLMAFVPAVVGMPYITLLPGFAAQDLHVREGAYGFLLTVSGAGALAGSLAIAGMTGVRRMPLLQSLAGFGFGASLITLGLLAMAFGYPGALAAQVVLGLCSTSYMTINSTMLMAQSRPELYGRVMSVYMITFSVFPLMAGPLGVLADRTSAVSTFILLGSIIIAFIALVTVADPRRLVARRAEPAAAQSEVARVSAGDD